ncbi:MAG: hypothetical protein IIA87_00200 [Nanoarchaeota archaeon]|nr:hypothetical protein [Nanoarchaeota archaeon]
MDPVDAKRYEGKPVVALFQTGRFVYQVKGVLDNISTTTCNFTKAQISVAGESIGARLSRESLHRYQSGMYPIGEERGKKEFSKISIDRSESTLIALCELEQPSSNQAN